MIPGAPTRTHRQALKFVRRADISGDALFALAPVGPRARRLALRGTLLSMPCCAGKAPHAAGSCAGGSCHAHVAVKKQAAPEKFCGLRLRPSLIARLRAESFARSDDRATRTAGVEPHANPTGDGERAAPTINGRVAPTALAHTCPPDCGACASAQLRRPPDTAALSQAGRARPPTPSSLAPHAQTFAPAHSSPRGQSNPRAPPSLS